MSKWIPVMLLMLLATPAAAEAPASEQETAKPLPKVHVYKTPTCGCCGKWVKHMRDNGFEVETTDMRSLDEVKTLNGVPTNLSSCHTALVGGYVVEGHVPASDVIRLLAERPSVTGIAVPRMPIGSPGMEGANPERYSVVTFDSDAPSTTFAVHGP